MLAARSAVRVPGRVHQQTWYVQTFVQKRLQLQLMIDSLKKVVMRAQLSNCILQRSVAWAALEMLHDLTYYIRALHLVILT